MCDGSVIPCLDEGWQPMVNSEITKFAEWCPKLAEAEESGAEEIDLLACTKSPELMLGLCCCGICMISRTISYANQEKCTPVGGTLCCPFVVPGNYCYVSICYLAMKGGEVRKVYNVKGTNQKDCLLNMCCCCCYWGDLVTRQNIYPPLKKAAAGAPPTQQIER